MWSTPAVWKQYNKRAVFSSKFHSNIFILLILFSLVSVHFAVTFLDCWRTSFCVTTITNMLVKVNLHLTPEMLQMFVYHLCYCLQSLLLLVRKNVTAKCTESQSPLPSIQFSLYNRPLLLFNSPCIDVCTFLTKEH